MRWSIIMILMVGILILSAFGAISVHGSGSVVTTDVRVIKNNSTVTQLNQGDNVKIAVTVNNTGNGVFTLSGQMPVYAYAKIYKLVNGVEIYVEKVSYTPKIVMFHMVTLGSGESYTSYIDWTVPSNVTGSVKIDAWAGNAPAGSDEVQVIGTESSSQSEAYLSVSTDALGYNPGETVYITVANNGNQDIICGEGFTVVDEQGNVVANVSFETNTELQPNSYIIYSWDIPEDINSGWYSISPYGSSSYAEIYIF